MAIVNSIASQFPAPGIPFYAGAGAGAFQKTAAIATAGGAATTTLTFPANAIIQRGRFRIKIANTANTPTIIVKAYFSDGTNKTDVLLPTAAFTPTDETQAASGVELLREFCIDITPTTFNVVTTLTGGGGTATLDFEVFGQQ